MVRVLFVCMGNICRSPMAQGIFEKLVKDRNLQYQIEIDSAGTHAYHVGDAPDPRAQRTTLKRGVDISGQRARKIKATDFVKFSHILAMDKSNLNFLEAMCDDENTHKLKLLMSFSQNSSVSEVPDPYYGGQSGFDKVLDMVEDASLGLLAVIQSSLDGKS